MRKMSEERKQQDYEFRQLWLAVLILLVLASSSLVVANWYGRGWVVIDATVAAALWFIIRPWRFGLVRPETRRMVRLLGAMHLCGYAIIAADNYWRYGS